MFQPIAQERIDSYKRIYAQLLKTFIAANRNQISSYPDTNAALAREACEWMETLTPTDEGVDDEILDHATTFLIDVTFINAAVLQ